MRYREETKDMPTHQKRFLEMQGYMAEDLIGMGAFGKVYRIWDIQKKCYLACKISHNREARGILKDEALLQCKIDHPLFARYEAYLEYSEYIMLLMEYVEGENLERYLKAGRMKPEQVVAVAIQLAEGIEYLHSLPDAFLYRDLKPENICLTGNGRVRLLDLGCVCRLKDAGLSRAGSPGYAPREQMCESQGSICVVAPGFYSDVYALGKLMHYMITGDNPAMPPYVKPPVGAYDVHCSPYLEQIISQCTQEQAEMRLPDMKCVLQKLRLFETVGMGARLKLKRREFVSVAERLLTGRTDSGFCYERNICIDSQLKKI